MALQEKSTCLRKPQEEHAAHPAPDTWGITKKRPCGDAMLAMVANCVTHPQKLLKEFTATCIAASPNKVKSVFSNLQSAASQPLFVVEFGDPLVSQCWCSAATKNG